MSFLIPTAYAAETTASQAGHPNQMLPLVILLFFGFFIYFMMWRPQSKRIKQHRSMVESLQKGDEVMTSGGILGKITKIDETIIKLAIADNIEVNVQKSAVSSILPKGTIK